MKLLYIILSFYIGILSVMPCADKAGRIYDNITSVSDQQDSHDNNCSDECSPFCSCACFSVSINYYTVSSGIIIPKTQYQDKANILYG